MSKILMLIGLLAPVSIGAEVLVKEPSICDQHPIYCQITKNKPKINKQYAMQLSNIIYKAAKKHQVKPSRLTAILAQESMYKLDAFNPKSKDYGIAQINHKTAENFNFDVEKLLTDLEYSVNAGAIVLADFKRMYGHKEDDFWTRYNSSKPEKREVYKQLVMRFL